MNGYKKIIRSQAMRHKILRFLKFVPDKTMIKLQYWIKLRRLPDLKNPKRYTEKLQWYKLYYKNPLMVRCADKYDVRQYVEDKGLGNILNKCYGVYDHVEDIDFDNLPNQFVLKDTLGGGGNAVIIVKDKETADLNSIKLQMQKWVSENPKIKTGGREWPYYSGKKHRIIVERFIPSNEVDGGLIDYKFFCFGGSCKYLYVIADRKLGQPSGIGIFDRDYNYKDCYRMDEKPLERKIPKPDNYDRMVSVAEKLSEDFPHARIDLFDQNGEILFGEITFYDGSGYMKFDPDAFDFELGEKFVLPEKRV
ncbi:MAG: carbonic anhydrase [Oscillospiraceae bacterium]|nr:carbonic anhydrase [Oscillospiraceae bacterium]